MRRNPKAGLFNGFWTDLEGNKIRRIYRSEYPELYRLHRLCSELESTARAACSQRWIPTEGGYAKISFPGVPVFYEATA